MYADVGYFQAIASCLTTLRFIDPEMQAVLTARGFL
jgi:hypothetical protein